MSEHDYTRNASAALLGSNLELAPYSFQVAFSNDECPDCRSPLFCGRWPSGTRGWVCAASCSTRVMRMTPEEAAAHDRYGCYALLYSRWIGRARNP